MNILEHCLRKGSTHITDGDDLLLLLRWTLSVAGSAQSVPVSQTILDLNERRRHTDNVSLL